VPVSEAAMRQNMIDTELKGMIEEMMKSEDFEEEDEMEPESYDAIIRAANEICYTRKYYDVSADKIIFFPSVTKTIVNFDLFEKATEYYFDEDDEFPTDYSMGLRNIVFERIEAEGDASDDEEMDDDLMERLSMAVQLTENDLDEIRQAVAAAEAEDEEAAEQESEKMEDSPTDPINPQVETAPEPLSDTFAAEALSTTEENGFGQFDQAPVDIAEPADNEGTKKPSVAEELAALENRSLTKNFTEKLKDADGLSTPEQEQAILQKTSQTNRAPIYKKEATESLNVGTTGIDQDLAFKQKQTALKKEDMQKKEEAVKNLQSFNTATVATAPTIPGTAFGSFDSTSGTQEKEGKPDEELSAFEEATNETMEKGEVDGFGDFSTPAQTEESTADDFGGWSQPLESQAGDNGQSVSPVDGGSNSVEAMEFGSFESTDPPSEQAVDQDVDGFGSFESTGPATEPVTTSQDTDEFGTFESPGAAAEAGESADEDADGFGSFESTGPATEQAASQDMDGFGSFESTTPATEADADHDADDFGTFESTGPATETPEGEMDGFGSFESTDPASEPVTTSQDADEFGTFETSGPEAEAGKPADQDGDGFGNFENFESTTPAVEAGESSDQQADEFGSFESTGPTTAQGVGEDADDFGTFESTGPAEEEASGQMEDDFGNFDSAPAAATLPPKTADGSDGMNGGSGPVDDEFGDFGDFDEAPAQPNQSQAVTAAESSAAQPTPATSSMLNGVFDMDRVRPVFTSLQSKYPFEQIGDDGGDSSLFGANSLESYLKSAQAEMNEKENDSAKLLLSKDFLGDATEEESSSSKLVIENDGRGPYHNFMAPVGGILQYSKNIVDVVLRDKKAAPIVYKSEPTRAPSTSSTTNKSASQTTDDSKASATAADGPQSKTRPAPPTATRVAIPPKEDASKPKSAGDDLASRIPDLSFMMKSHLVLPKK